MKTPAAYFSKRTQPSESTYKLATLFLLQDTHPHPACGPRSVEMDMVGASSNAVITILAITVILINQGHSQQQRKVYSASVGENITLSYLDTIPSEVASLVCRKDGMKVLTYSVNDASQAEDKYRLVGNTTGTWLKILNVDHSDAGRYSCFGDLRNGKFIFSDVMDLFVTEILVSPCDDDSQNNVDGCSCYINGGDTSDLSCRTLGFPRKPNITWKFPDDIQLKSSTVNLASYSDNMTLVCRAQDASVLDVTLESDPVCVFYPLQMEATDKLPEQGAVTSDNKQELDTTSSNLWWIIFPICIVIVSAIIVIFCLYRRGYLKDFGLIRNIAESRCLPNCLKNYSQRTNQRYAMTQVKETEEPCNGVPVIETELAVHIPMLDEPNSEEEPIKTELKMDHGLETPTEQRIVMADIQPPSPNKLNGASLACASPGYKKRLFTETPTSSATASNSPLPESAEGTLTQTSGKESAI